MLLVDGYDQDGLPSALSSQGFYDDCYAMLAPGGMLVVNLHCGRNRGQQQVSRIRRSFQEAVLTVHDDDGSNSVVFASKTSLPTELRAQPERRPRNLGDDAWNELRGTFARVQTAIAAESA